jgi:hypothetical protein
MFELLFLFAFSLHNTEEALWLPAWSTTAGRFHPAVGADEFRFGVLVVTLIGYLATFLFLAFGASSAPIRYAYFGFLMMMALNAVFPHLVATIALGRYAPGTMTGLFLNLPLSSYIVFIEYRESPFDSKLLAGVVGVTILMLASLKPLFALGRRVTNTQSK